MNIFIKEMAVEHYRQVLSLWETSEGVGLSEADSPEGIAGFLERNPGLSYVAYDARQLVGVVLCGGNIDVATLRKVLHDSG